MMDQESQPSRAPSRAEQRMAAVAKLRRAASLPRMKDGRRPPMHVEAVSEGEKQPTDEEKFESEEEKQKVEEGQLDTSETEQGKDVEETQGIHEFDSDHLPPPSVETTADIEVDADTELEERSMSPGSGAIKRRRRSRSRSRGSKELRGKIKPPTSPMPQLAGDSSQDETPHMPSPMLMPMVSPLASPVPHFPFLQQSRLLRSPTPLPPDMSLYYPGPSPPTPLPTLEDLQKGLIRSNSLGATAAGRRLALHKLTGGTEPYYDPSPPPTPPPLNSKLSRNNTVAGGERIAARQNLLNRLGTRVTREADAEAASGAEERNTPSQASKRRRRRSRRTSAMNANTGVSDSDFPSSDLTSPAVVSQLLQESQGQYAELRAQSTTPSQALSSRTHSSEQVSGTTPAPLPSTAHLSKEEHERPEQYRRRSVVIEDPDDDVQNDGPSVPQQQYPTLPGTPKRTFQAIDVLRANATNTPSNSSSSDSSPTSAVGVPVFLSQRAASRNEPFPTSPFTTPLKERPFSDYEEEQVLYPATTARPRTPYGNIAQMQEREISWVASPVPEIRMPIHDDESDPDGDVDDSGHHDLRAIECLDNEKEEENPPSVSAESSNGFTSDVYNDMSPRVSASSKSVLIESETSPGPVASYFSSSPSLAAAASQSPSVIRIERSGSPQSYPQRLSVASRLGERSPLSAEFSDLEGYIGADSPKRVETSTPSTWEKVKNTLVRAGSSSGRRSRTNSIVTRERRDNTESSISRESGGSLTTSKIDTVPSNQLQAATLMQSPSASASILSLAPPGPPRMNASPIPPASDLSKYQNSKLFPFPGMVRLEEERRAKGFQFPTNPDMSTSYNDELLAPPMTPSWSSGSSQTADAGEHKISRQNSPMGKYAAEPLHEYIDVSPSHQHHGSGSGMKLPMTLPGVKLWLKNSKKKTTSPTPTSTTESVSSSPLPGIDSNSSTTSKRPSLSDIFSRRPNEVGNDWDETPVTSDSSRVGSGNMLDAAIDINSFDPTTRGQPAFSLDSVPSQNSILKVGSDLSSPSRLAAATPDPSSLSDYPAPTPSESSTSSNSSSNGRQGRLVLERLEENLSRFSRSPMWSAAVDDPPRKLVLSSPVLQVVNQNTVKDRFLFLFTDILVIAKPITADPHDSFTDPYKLSLPDKKYTVKNVVQLQKLRFCSDRTEASKPAILGPRGPLIRSFITEFAVDPDRAIASLFSKAKTEVDPALLGQLLFKTLDIDRSRLGDYLSRRMSKAVLKAYLDSFGFAGLRVDVALRVFLQSINISQYTHSYGALEYLLDSFASRWYEANAKFVAYDKDMAVQLVWALVQLNDRLHGPIADEPGATDQILRTVTTREFQDAFRRYDSRYLVSDELLQELYRSIFQERLCQACPSIMNSQEISVTIKRALPCRLTYKAQSEPIVFRLPQPDPHFTIELYGQDLIFDPPILHFSRSAEASFRVTGASLGLKIMTMCRSGPNATKYSGLPLNHSIVVERAFMKNTFQIAFVNPAGTKRKYMFSVDDPIIRNEWATCIRRQIDASNATAAALKSAGSFASSKFHRAAQNIAFEILQEKLVGSSILLVHRSNGSLQNGNSVPQLTGSSAPFSTTPVHMRSKSRSRVYRYGAGKDELELNRLQNISGDSNNSSDINVEDHRVGGNLWTSRDLELYCQQNSSISLVLSFLQVGAPELVSS